METKKTSVKNRAARAIASVFGVTVGLAGIEHGFFEILQGNQSTEGLLIEEPASRNLPQASQRLEFKGENRGERLIVE